MESPDHKLLRALDFNRYFFAPTVVITFGVLALEAVTYPGFVLRSIGMPTSLFIMLSAVSFGLMLVQIATNQLKPRFETTLVLTLNIILNPLILLIYHLLTELEKNNYPNYIFSTFHIHVSAIKTIVIFNILLSFLFALQKYLPRIAELPQFQQKTLRYKIGQMAFLFCIGFMVAKQSFLMVTNQALATTFMLKNPLASFEEKQTVVFGQPHQIFNFIKKHVPEESIVAVPPQSFSGIIGNIGYARYFLYPRFLVHPEEYTKDTMPNIKYYFFSTSITNLETGEYLTWPKEPIKAERIYTIDEFSLEQSEVEAEYFDPSDPIYKNRVGIIEVSNP